MSAARKRSEPIYFRCFVAAREMPNSFSPGGGVCEARGHVVELTGKAFGGSLQYRCACGHVGRSSHSALQRLAQQGDGATLKAN